MAGPPRFSAALSGLLRTCLQLAFGLAPSVCSLRPGLPGFSCLQLAPGSFWPICLQPAPGPPRSRCWLFCLWRSCSCQPLPNSRTTNFELLGFWFGAMPR